MIECHKLPEKLIQLATGPYWPKNRNEIQNQYSNHLVSRECLKKLIPEEERLYFYDFPFCTLSETLKEDSSTGSLTMEDGAILSPEHVIVIGDFGIGSDSYLAIDFNLNRENPRVIKEMWSDFGNVSRQTHWRIVAETFDDLVVGMKLEKYLR